MTDDGEFDSATVSVGSGRVWLSLKRLSNVGRTDKSEQVDGTGRREERYEKDDEFFHRLSLTPTFTK